MKKFTIENAAMLLIDHEKGPIELARSLTVMAGVVGAPKLLRIRQVLVCS